MLAAVLAAVLAMVIPGLSACSSAGDAVSSSGDGVVEEFEPGERPVLDEFTGTTLEGTSFGLSDQRGTVLVINVWGSWCVPCRAEASALRRVSQEFKPSGVRFMGVNVRDNDAAARAFERTLAIDYPSINTDSSSAAVLSIGQVVPSAAVPSTVVLDREGKVAARVVGASSYITLAELVKTVVSEASNG